MVRVRIRIRIRIRVRVRIRIRIRVRVRVRITLCQLAVCVPGMWCSYGSFNFICVSSATENCNPNP